MYFNLKNPYYNRKQIVIFCKVAFKPEYYLFGINKETSTPSLK